MSDLVGPHDMGALPCWFCESDGTDASFGHPNFVSLSNTSDLWLVECATGGCGIRGRMGGKRQYAVRRWNEMQRRLQGDAAKAKDAG